MPCAIADGYQFSKGMHYPQLHELSNTVSQPERPPINYSHLVEVFSFTYKLIEISHLVS